MSVDVVVSHADVMGVMQAKSTVFMPTIAILNPLAVLRLIKSIPDTSIFFKKARFILDDMHRRSLAVDLLVEQLKMLSLRSDDSAGQLILMSATPDRNLLHYLGRVEEIAKGDDPIFKVTHRVVEAADELQITHGLVEQEVNAVLTDWGNKVADMPPGTMVVYLPSEARCRRFAERLLNRWDRCRITTQRPIVPLFSPVRHNGTAKGLFARATQEIEIKKVERDADFAKKEPPIFFLPIVFTRQFTETGLTMLTAQMPADVGGELVRIVITTGETPSVFIPDVTVVIDCGLHEVEYCDLATVCQRGADSRGTPQPEEGPIGKTNAGVAVQFTVPGLVRPAVLVPPVKRLNLLQPITALLKLGYTFADFKNLPNEPDSDVMNHCKQTLKTLGITDDRDNITPLGMNESAPQSRRAKLASRTYWHVIGFIRELGNRRE
jgi:HrpA-like RNA helicase